MDKNRKLKLVYASEWEKDRNKTWSGTTYFLNKALRRYANIEELDITVTTIQKIISKFKSMNLKKLDFSINRIPTTISKDYLRFLKRNYLRKLEKIDKNEIVLLIGKMDGFSGKFYTYQDIAFHGLLELKDKGARAFDFSGYKELSREDLEKEAKNEMKAYQSATGIFTMSKWLKNYMVEKMDLPEEKIHAVGGGSNMDINTINPDRKGNKFLFVGRQFINKGGPLIQDAFKILKQKYMPEAELYIVGPRQRPKGCFGKGIHFLGPLEYSRLVDYYNICDVFCMPSEFDAYGLVFIEALTFGLPCIGRRAFEMEYFIKEGVNGDLIDDKDTQENVAIKMYSLIKNEKIKENVKNQRDYYIQEYSWDTVAKRIINIIQNDIHDTKVGEKH